MIHPHPDDPPLIPLARDAAPRYPADGGGDGGVTIAHDPRLRRAVAVKRLAAAAPPEDADRLVREAQLQGRLEHPAIVPVLDAGLDADGRPYFVMRQVRGTPLAEVLRRREPDPRFPVRRLLAAFVEIGLAIEHAHARGVAHRGLTSDEVLLGDYGEVYVQGWGRAEVAPPGGAVDGAADARALAGLLFEVLHLRPLGAAADVHAAARATGRPGPPELVDAIAAALAAAAAPGTPRALADAVRRWLDGVRDLQRRRELGARHRDRARAALAAGDHATAMREAGSAVALAPGDREATELLGRLVLEPPDADDGAAGAAAIDASDAAEVRAQAKVAALSYLALPAFLPLLLWLGVEQAAVPVALAALGLAQAALAVAAARGRLTRSWLWISTAGNVVILALCTRVFGPVLAVPAMAATLAMSAGGMPNVRPWWAVAAMLGAGVLAPWGLEELGVLAPTIWTTGDAVAVDPHVVALPRGPTLAVLALHTAALVVISANYARHLTRVSRDARRRLLSHAWHLEQIARTPR